MKLPQQNKWRVTTAAGMVTLLHKWGDTVSTIDSTLGAFCSKPGLKINPHHLPRQRQCKIWCLPLPLARNRIKISQTMNRRIVQKNPQIGVFSPLFLFEPLSHFKCRREVVEGQLWGGVRVMWCPTVSFVLFAGIGWLRRVIGRVTASPKRTWRGGPWVTIHHIHSASCHGGWGWEEWRHVLKTSQWSGTQPPPLALHCSAWTSATETWFLPCCGSGLGSGPKVWHAFPFSKIIIT